MGLYFLAILIAAFAHAFSWNGFLLWASYIKLVITAIKYIPQAYMNFVRKSTEGWSIGNVLLDFTGGTFSILQMAFDVYNFSELPNFSFTHFRIFFDLLIRGCNHVSRNQ